MPNDDAADDPNPLTDADPQPAALGLFDRARLAREQATAKASELASRAGELKDQAATRAGDMKDQVAAKASEIKDASITKVGDVLDDFNAALPIIRQAGYALVSVDLQLGLPPKIIAKFGAPVDATEERTNALLAEHGDNVIAGMVLRAIQVQTKFKIGGLKPSGMEVELGLTPRVTVRFS
jgi:hypothetical protein